MLGTTFGGGHLACAAALSVLEVIAEEELRKNAAMAGAFMQAELAGLEGVTEVRGKGLMIGCDTKFPASDLRNLLLCDYQVLTGSGGGASTIRLLPPLTFSADAVKMLVEAFAGALQQLEQQGSTA